MKSLALLSLTALLCVGCSGSGDPGNVDVAQKASAAAPKAVADLPQNMPPEARTGAAAGIGQADAQKKMNSDPARLHAMQMMQQQKGH